MIFDSSYDSTYKEYIRTEHWKDFVSEQNLTDAINFANAQPCNFFEQSTCISTLHESFDETEFSTKCLPNCFHTAVHQQGIYVSVVNLSLSVWTKIKYKTMDPEQIKNFRKRVTKGKNADDKDLGQLN